LYYKLALKNLASRKTRTFLTALGICVGIASLVLLLALSAGIRKAIFQNITSGNPLTQITVQPKSSNSGFLKLLQNDNKNKITPEMLQKINQLPHVQSVYPEMIFSNIASLEVNIWSQVFQTDTMIFGVPYEFIAADFKGTKADWEQAASPYPAIVSRKIIDLYNFTVAPTNNLPNFTEKDITGTNITILPNQSTFFPQLGSAENNIPGRIAGFSDKTSLVGVTIPIEVVRSLNKQRDPSYQENYLRLYLQIDKPENVDVVTAEIKAMDLDTFSPQQEIKIIEDNFRVVTLGLSLVSLIILFVAGLMIANTFLSSVAERKHEIGIFRSLGATRGDIKKVFLAEASLVGLIGGAAGIITGLIGSLLLNKYALDALPAFSAKPESLFVHEPLTVLGTLLFAILLSTLFALIPAAKAARLNPLEALAD
jgi:putative ABC transport system permease protein